MTTTDRDDAPTGAVQPLQLQDILSRAEGATLGPWAVIPYGDGDSLVIHEAGERRICFMATPGSEAGALKHITANAAFIAHAREDVPALCREVERLEDACRTHVADYDRLEAEADRLRALVPVWRGIESAPKGGGADDTRDPAWVEPPLILLRFGEEATSVARWDWYYAEGGNGYDPGLLAWIEPCSGESLSLHYEAPTHWMPLPAVPGGGCLEDQERHLAKDAGGDA